MHSASGDGFGRDSGDPTWSVQCEGYDFLQREYRFCVRHRRSGSWPVQRPFQELSAFHDKLSMVVGSVGLPEFPSRLSHGGMVLKLFENRPKVVADRQNLLQRYFDALCANDDATRTACFQSFVGVKQPEPVGHFSVVNWLPPTNGDHAACAVVDVRPEIPGSSNAVVVEAYHLIAYLIFIDHLSGEEELARVVDMLVPASSSSIQVPDLAFGAKVELRLVAENAVGKSVPVTIRCVVPRMSADFDGMAPSRQKSPNLESATREELDCRLRELQQQQEEIANQTKELHLLRQEQDKLTEDANSDGEEQPEAIDGKQSFRLRREKSAVSESGAAASDEVWDTDWATLGHGDTSTHDASGDDDNAS
eukprot:TRINITY_DN57579_c0_g1_i1.p1 TRINITY_DN57579_c0_g1~~TRINITY_DN57579_c0_g1_i1.p1  ORF type:complete len:364 (+),score=68.79 TRINITY_DN57579_c0_g1_i1:116-1207(+)